MPERQLQDEYWEGSAAMNCAEFNQTIHDVDRVGALSQPERFETLRHAGECVSCGILLEQVRTLNSELAELASADGALQAPARVEIALKTIFRQGRAMEVHARAWRRWAWAAAAAVIVAGAMAALTLRHGPGQAAPVTAQTPAPKNPPAVQPAAEAPQQQAQDASSVDVAENPDDFVPLPDSLPLAPAEEPSIVRVRLYRGALSAFGLTVDDEQAADLIQVEFLIAQDGTPQAMRYVR
jgi:hypothetical protein